jgi:hypothetical protein
MSSELRDEKMSLTFDGTKGTVKKDLADLPEKMLEYAFEVLMDRAYVMKGYAQIFVRVKHGYLRDSIRVERGGEGKHWRRVRVRAGGYVPAPMYKKRVVDYAAIVEAKYPYMKPAWLQVRDTIADMIKARVVEECSYE